MKPPVLVVDTVVLCEEVRREITGKDLLLGVYSGGIAVTSFPALIKIAFWIQVRAPTPGNYPVVLQVTSPKREQLATFEAELTLEKAANGIAFATGSLPLNAAVPGTYKVTFQQRDQPAKIIKQFVVELMDDETRQRLFGPAVAAQN